MTGSPYSTLKIFHHQDRLRRLSKGEHPVLLHVHLVPTNKCQMRCNFCAYRMHGYSSSEDFAEKDQIPYEVLHDFVEDCKEIGVKAIELTGGGEPTIHPQFVELCETIRENGINYSVVTNGANLNDQKLQALLRANWVRVSIDAGTPETYAWTRKSSSDQFYRTRYNIRSLATLRDQESVDDLLIGVGFVVTKDNYREIVQAVKNAREDGVDNVRISAVFQSDGIGYFNEFFEEAKDLCHQAKELQTSSFTVFNLFGERAQDLIQEFPEYSFCGYQHFVTYVGADQNVYRCCTIAYNPRGFLGSLKGKRFKDLWRDAKGLLYDFDAKRCPHCMFNSKNRRIEYALCSDPQHVNFL